MAQITVSVDPGTQNTASASITTADTLRVNVGTSALVFTYTVTFVGGTAGGTVSPTSVSPGGFFIYTPGSAGTRQITIGGFDTETFTPVAATLTVTVTAAASNDPPVFTTQPFVIGGNTVTEGTAFQIRCLPTDPDGDDLRVELWSRGTDPTFVGGNIQSINGHTSGTNATFGLTADLVEDGTPQYYYIRIIDNTGSGSNTTVTSNNLAVNLVAATPTPGTPSTFTATPTTVNPGGTVTLAASGSSDATSYEFRMRTSTNDGVSYGSFGSAFTSTTFSVPTSATEPTRYQFQARGVNSGGSGAWTTNRTVSVALIAPDSNITVDTPTINIGSAQTTFQFTLSGLQIGDQIRVIASGSLNVLDPGSDGTAATTVTSTTQTFTSSSRAWNPTTSQAGTSFTHSIQVRRPTSAGGANAWTGTGETFVVARAFANAAPELTDPASSGGTSPVTGTTYTLSTNVSDIDGDTLTVRLFTGSTNTQTFTNISSGSMVTTSALTAGAVGSSQTYHFTVSDGSLTTTSSTITVTPIAAPMGGGGGTGHGIEFYDTAGNVKLSATEVMGKTASMSLTGLSSGGGTMTIPALADATDVVAVASNTGGGANDISGQPAISVSGTTLTYGTLVSGFDRIDLRFF